MEKKKQKTKYLIVLGDGMADHADANGQTPLSLAKKPFIDELCFKSELALVQTVPIGMAPGSDTANLSVMGYDPKVYYTGRSPLEAASIGVKLNNGDVTFRMNLVSLREEAGGTVPPLQETPVGAGLPDRPQEYENLIMHDYSAGEIETAEAKKLVEILKPYAPEGFELFAGTSYRHCMVFRQCTMSDKNSNNNSKLSSSNSQLNKDNNCALNLTPPHDITDKPITHHLPPEPFLSFIKKSYEVLKNHPDNKTKANSAWIWGMGTKPLLTDFSKKFGVKGAVISEVDLIKGIGLSANMTSIDVDGADGSLHTNYEGMVEATIKAFDTHDFVYLHIEAPDEMGHKGDKDGKILSIEFLNDRVVKPLVESLTKNYHLKMLFLPDHATPLKLKTHTDEPVPYMLYDSNSVSMKHSLPYTELGAKESGVLVSKGHELIVKLLK